MLCPPPPRPVNATEMPIRSKTQRKGPILLNQAMAQVKGSLRTLPNLGALLHSQDQPSYRNFVRMRPELFNELEQRLTPALQSRTDLDLRAPRSRNQLGHHLETLSCWRKLQLLQNSLRVDQLAISRFFSRCLLFHNLEVSRYSYGSIPITLMSGRKFEVGFSEKCNLSHTICAVMMWDKHMAMFPIVGGSQYCKEFHLICWPCCRLQFHMGGCHCLLLQLC